MVSQQLTYHINKYPAAVTSSPTHLIASEPGRSHEAFTVFHEELQRTYSTPITQTGGRQEPKHHAIENLLLQALVLQEQALALAESEGQIGLFVNEESSMAQLLQRVLVSGMVPRYAASLMAALGTQERKPEDKALIPVAPRSSDSALPELLEPLSERELEVLRLMAAGQSNSEIARALFVSMGTVKTHLRHIYGKLDVHTRTQAVARARVYQLLPS